MVEYDFNEVGRFWDMVYEACEERGIVIEYKGREGRKGEGDFGKFVEVVEEVVLKFCEVKY